MKFKVLIDLGKLKMFYSGLGQYSWYYGRFISRKQYKNLHWHFLTPDHFKGKFGHRWSYESLSMKRRYLPGLCRSYDLWHAIHQDSAYFPSNRKTPYILTIHDLNFLREKNRFIARRRLHKLQRKVNRATMITFISRYTASVATKNLDLKNKPTEIIYNGVDIDTGKDVKRPAFLPDGKFLFTIGMVLEKKNFHVLIDFMKELPEYNLVIAGDKSDYYAFRMEKDIRRKKLAGRIIMPGIITHDQKIYLYRHCEAFLFPSRMEGFGLPVIEAMRFGKPAFLSNMSSLPEIGGELAYYWDHFNAGYMSRIFKEKMRDYRADEKACSKKLRDYAARFTWEKSMRKYTEIYEKVIRQYHDQDFELGPPTEIRQGETEKVRVLHLSSEPSWRGGEQQIAYLVEELQDKVENFIACRRGSKVEKFCQDRNWDHYSLGFRSPLDLKTAREISDICKAQKIDIIHLHTSLGHTLGVLSTWFGHQASLVLSRRVDVPMRKNFFSRWKYNHPRIRRILTVSDAIRNTLNRTLSNHEIAETVYSGIDVNKFKASGRKNRLREQYGLEKDQILIGNTSALAPVKDYTTFLDTASYVIAHGARAVFFIIGEGSERKNIEKYILRKGLENHVILTGFLSNIPEILPELDIFLMTSRSEGLGTSILDAFACGVPVVATRTGGIPEMVRHEETGLLADVGDASTLGDHVLRLMKDPELGENLADNAGKLLMKEFTRQRTAEKTWNTYLKIIDQVDEGRFDHPN